MQVAHALHKELQLITVASAHRSLQQELSSHDSSVEVQSKACRHLSMMSDSHKLAPHHCMIPHEQTRNYIRHSA